MDDDDEEPMTVSRLLQITGLVPSRAAAYRLIKAGGAYLNNRKITPPDELVFGSDLLHGKYLILRKGKKNVAAVEFTD